MVAGPRKILRLPSMCAMTKPTSTMPVTAITTFLPTMVPHTAETGLAGHTPRGARTATVLSNKWDAIFDLLLPLRCSGNRLGYGRFHRKTHRKRDQGEAGGQSQGPQANRALTRRTDATADSEADDRRPTVRRSAACLSHLVRIAPEQDLADIHHGAGDVGRHHCRGRCAGQRDLRKGVLHRHRRHAKHAREDRVCWVRVDVRSGSDAEDEKAAEQEE